MAGDLVVSLHDVAPSTLTDIRRLRDALDARGVRPRVLMVIPEHAADPAVRTFLADERVRGSEIVLHGYTHRAEAARPLRGNPYDTWRARSFAADAAEFLTLSDDEMRERVRRGRDALAALGLAPGGFCAPAWLAAPALRGILRAEGFRYDVSMWTLADLVRRRTLATPWVGAVRADGAQERLVGLVSATTRALAPALPLVTAFLHPAPESHGPTRAALEAIVALAAARRVVTYSRLLA